MTTYLSLSGTNSYIKTPSITFNEVIMDFTPHQISGIWKNYIDPRTGINAYFNNNTSNVDGASGWSAIYVDGVLFTGSTLAANIVPKDTRTTLRLLLSSAGTDDVNLFSKNTNDECMKAEVYDIKFYNAGVLVAHYDMSTGTVQDISGNGKHATLIGGTWLDDGTGGGTGTTYSGAGTSAGTSSLTQSEKVIQSASGTSQGSSSLSSTETVISHTGTTYSESGTAQGSSSLSNNETVIYGANGSSQGTTILSPGEHLILPSVGTSTGQSSISSNETVVGHGTTTYSGSGQAQGSSSLSSAETMSYIATGTAQGLSSLIAHEIISLLASGISEGYSTLTFIDKSNQIIGTIHLKGSQVLNVTLQGSQVLNVNLKGGI